MAKFAVIAPSFSGVAPYLWNFESYKEIFDFLYENHLVERRDWDYENLYIYMGTKVVLSSGKRVDLYDDHFDLRLIGSLMRQIIQLKQ